MVKYGVLCAVSARDRSSCGASGFRGGSGSGLMWGRSAARMDRGWGSMG